MTNEQAINQLKAIRSEFAVDMRLNDVEAFDMAIEALQRGLENVNADSCSEKPNNSDTISRSDAIKVLIRKEREQYNDWKRSGDERSLCAKKAYGRSIFEIYNLPSAEVRTQMSSADCIRRQDAIDLVQIYLNPFMKYIGSPNDTECKAYARTILHNIVDNLRVGYKTPSAQPEIIRCKDCKYMMEHYDTDGNAPYWTCSEWDSGTDYDGFCSYAERKGNG